MRTISILAVLILAPIGVSQMAADHASKVAGPVMDGHEITCDLAPAQQFANTGSRLDGAGLCVFTSMEMAARYQGLEQMRGFRNFVAEHFTGGGWPDRTDKVLQAWWKFKGIEPVLYYQYEGRDPEPVMEVLDRTRRMACITYGWSPRYGQPIAHMVCAPRFNGDYGVVLDNNFVATKEADGSYNEGVFEWMPKAELIRRMKLGTGSAWVFAWMPPPPPPPARAKVNFSKFIP